MKNLKFGIKLLPFLLAGSMTVAVGVPAYENRPRKFDEITDCTNIDRVIYEKYEKISYEDFKKLLGEKNKEFLIEYKIVETGEENRTILDSDDILNEREYLAFHDFNRQNINLFEAIENGEIEIKGIHYIHHVVLEDDELKNFDIEDAYLRENLDDVFNIECLDRNGRATISGKVIFDRSKDGDITAKCSYKINRKNIFGKNIQPRTIKKCYKTIPESENNDQCKYDDTSISSQVNLKNPKGRLKYLDSTTMTYDEMKTVLEYARNKATELAEEMISGKIKPSPYISGNEPICKNCEYKSICGYDAELTKPRILERKTTNNIIDM